MSSMSTFAGRGAAGSPGLSGGGSIGASVAGAGSIGVGAAGAGSVGAGVAGTAAAPAAAGCGFGEMCKTSLRGGGVQFCTRDPLAALPPPCTTVGAACGTNGAGNCVDARPLGQPGMLFCIYDRC